MTLSIISWCPGTVCDPCKPQPQPPLYVDPLWPAHPTAFRIWIYAVQDHYTSGHLDGGALLAGYGAQIYTSSGLVSSFDWVFGPNPAPVDTVNGYGSVHYDAEIDFFDGAGGRSIPGAGYGTFAEALALGPAYQHYYGFV